MKYFKILNEKETHNGLRYKIGMNKDALPFNPSGSCQPGGLYFSDVKNIFRFVNYGPWIREVIIPKGEVIYTDPEGDKYKAHRIKLGKRMKLWDEDTMTILLDLGADVHAGYDHALRWAAEKGHTV